MEKFKKYIPQLFYVAATLNFIASILASINGNNSGPALGIGGLCLVLAVFTSERNKKDKDKE